MKSTMDSPHPRPVFSDESRIQRVQAVCPQFDTRLRTLSEQSHVPGLAYGIIANGELIHAQSFGVREVATQAPVDADTVFRIASMTKSFTAAAIFHLRDAGKVQLDAPAATYVPELTSLEYPTTDSAPVTVRQLLTMNAGWPQDDPWADRQLYRTDEAMSAFFAEGVSWSNPPGVLFEYSNYGYMILGRIITNVSGIPAVEYITRELLQPLGMSATVWDAADVPPDHLAHGYRWEDEQWKEEAMLPCGGDVACFAGLFTSVRDLTRWVDFFLDAWPPRNDADDGPLRRSTRRKMQQIGTAISPTLIIPSDGSPPQVSGGGYCFGLSLMDNGEWRSVGHGGGLPGFGSHMRWLPDYDLGIIALGNVTYAPLHQLSNELLGELVTLAELAPRRSPVPAHLLAACHGMIQLMDDWDDGLADNLFADNLLLDSDAEHRQRRLAELKATHGPLQWDGNFQMENWLRGRWRMMGETGSVDVSITLSPTVPPRVQMWRFTSNMDGDV